MTADLLQQFNAAKVLVVGDVMLDRYWFGDTHRISPEAPVPVAKIERKGKYYLQFFLSLMGGFDFFM